jgi:hypothetical protein
MEQVSMEGADKGKKEVAGGLSRVLWEIRTPPTTDAISAVFLSVAILRSGCRPHGNQ